MKQVVKANIGGKEYSIESGQWAKQAHGSVVVRVGETMVLVTAVSAREARPDVDFLPLTVDFKENNYAAGRIPGGFFRREARPTEKETLTSRLIDRPLRPLFPEGYNFETQVIAQVISADPEEDGDVLAITGASAALAVSDIPFDNWVAGVRVCRVEGQFQINPGPEAREKADIEIIVAATEEALVMVEGGALEVSEGDIMDALDFAHEHIKEFIALQKQLREKIGKTKRTFEPVELPDEYFQKVKNAALADVRKCFDIAVKDDRYLALDSLKAKVLEKLVAEYPEGEQEEAKDQLRKAYGKLKHDTMREMILKEKKRINGRGFDVVRDISCEIGVLPRAHGSAIFTRGETQALVTVTLGSKEDEQRVETLKGSHFKRFLLHYNFPPFSVGEARFLRGPGRREIGHGKLAERAVEKIIPLKDPNFPFTVRIVSDILESNGSSSMATVCGSSLALMDAGIKVSSDVAGIAMGLIKEGDDVAILSDILGDEDHLGDMDFKVCGSDKGISSIQMDIKIAGVTRKIMTDALEQARKGRLHILGKMREAIQNPKAELSPYAPRTHVMMINPEKIKNVIGSQGKIIKSIIEETRVKIDIEDSGKVTIFSLDPKAIDRAVEIVKNITEEPELGRIYQGRVMKIMDFGAFVEIIPGTEGLVHISQLAPERVHSVEDVTKEGDEMNVKLLEIDRNGKLRLSRKEAIGLEVGTVHEVKAQPHRSGPPGGGRNPRNSRRAR